MRRLVWIVGVFGLLWSAWWLFAALSLQAGITSWLEDRRSEGWQADVAEISYSGFPLRLEHHLDAPIFADPDTGVAFSSQALAMSAPVWWPGHVSVFVPENQMRLATPARTYDVTVEGFLADLRLNPGTELELETLAASSGSWQSNAGQVSMASAQGLKLGMQQRPESASVYDFSFDAPGFQLGAGPRAALRIPQDWPFAFDALALEATIAFDRPIDRHTIEDARPQPRRIDLARAEAAWGDLRLLCAAGLDVTPQGLLNGDVSLQVRNWRDILDLAQTSGYLPPALRPQIENVVQALARGSGNPDALDLTLTIQDSTVFLGFVPVGFVPPLVLR